jgi:cell division protein FtsB
MLTYTQNQDFWRGEKVWRGREVEPAAERRANTPALYTKAGDITGMSPERLRAAKRTLVPDNPALWGVEEAVDFFGTPNDEKVREGLLIEASQKPFMRKMLRFTPGRQLTRDDAAAAKRLGVPTRGRAEAAVLNDLEKARKAVDSKKQMVDVRFDKLAAQVKAGTATKAQLMREIYRLKDERGRPMLDEMKRVRARLRNRYPELRIPGGA